MFHLFGNETVPPPAQWHPQPTSRGTFSVLSSCLLTMFLCVWTAVHLNIPEHGKEHQQFWRKAGWLTLGLLAPEIVAWNAWVQRRQVKKLTRDVQALQRRQRGIAEVVSKPWYRRAQWSKIPLVRWLRQAWRALQVWLLCRAEDVDMSAPDGWPRFGGEETEKDLWTDVHSWFTIMGGFAFDTSTAEKPFLPGKRERAVLTPEGILILAQHWPSLLPKLSANDVWDKSKSDGWAKLLSCWQATWFCVQFIFRLAGGLSISFLELNVFGHAVCALLIYVTWWTKPKDIMEPTKLTGGDIDAIAALFCNLSPIGKAAARSREDRDLRFWEYTKPSWVRAVPGEAGGGFSEFFPERTPIMWFAAKDVTAPRALRVGDSYWCIDSPLQAPQDHAKIEVDTLLASRLLLMRNFDASSPIWKLETPVALVRFKMPDWSISLDWIDPQLGEKHQHGMIVACALYGGMHTLAWNAAFPTALEQLLWRTASITVASTGVMWSLSLLYGIILDLVPLNGILCQVPPLFRIDDVVTALYVLWYGLCRAFLVVECFINIAHLSQDALQVPVWSTYVPHLS